MMLIGAIALLASIGGGGILWGIVGMALLLGGGWLLFNLPRREYQLLIRTSNSEAMAFSSREEAEVRALRDAIEAAMVNR